MGPPGVDQIVVSHEQLAARRADSALVIGLLLLVLACTSTTAERSAILPQEAVQGVLEFDG